MQISTMTYVATFESSRNIQDIYDKYVNKLIDNDLYIEDKKTKITKKGKPKKSFGNQMTVKSKSMRFNMKIFYNKKIQLTGIKSIDDLIKIFKRLEVAFGFEISSPRLVMKNMVSNLGVEIKLYDMYEELRKDGLDVHYSPEIYPGLKLKHHNATALVFATGKMIISTKSIEQPYELEKIVQNCAQKLHDFQNDPCGNMAQIATA